MTLRSDKFLYVVPNPFAGELDHDLVRALRPNLGLGDAELVDAAPHDVDGAVQVLFRQAPVRRGNGLERDLEAALEIEAERWPLLERRPRHGEEQDAGNGGDQQSDDEDG